MAHIRRKGPSWVVDYRDPRGKGRSKSFRTKAEARRFEAAVETAKNRGEWRDPRSGKVVFGRWMDTNRETWHGLSDSTTFQREGFVRTHIAPRWGQAPIGAITQLEVQGWVNALVAQGLSASTVRQVYQVFQRAMAGAVRSGLVASSPCQGIALPREAHNEMHFLAPEQVEALADAADPHGALILSAAYTGLRWGELVGLRRKHIHMLKSEVQVAEQLTEVNGRLAFKAPKTPQSRRIVSLPHFLVEVLARHLEGASTDSDALVFVGRDGKPLRRSNFRSRIWKPALELAGLNSELRFHDLRHTHVAFCIAQGMSEFRIMRRLGHTSIKTTLDRYGHLLPEEDDAFREGLDALYRASRAGFSPDSSGSKVVALPSTGGESGL